MTFIVLICIFLASFLLGIYFYNLRRNSINIGTNYLTRYFIIPRNKWFNIYLHKYKGSDYKEFHDHPWHSMSILLAGKLHEIQRTELGQMVDRRIFKFIPKFRTPQYSHRIILRSRRAWTIFFTGPTVRPWGFWVDGRWFSAMNFVDENGKVNFRARKIRGK